MLDTVCKSLIESFPTDFASWLLGEPVPLTELSPTELSLEPIRADALMLLQSPEQILHLEVQTRPDPNIPFRMLDYRVRGHRRYPQKTMRQVVVYLKQTESPLVHQTTFSLENTQHQFQAIRLWEQPLDTFLAKPGLLPLAVLSQTNDRETALRQVAKRLEAIPDRRQQNNLTASAYILSGLVLEQALIDTILMRDILEESVTYQSIKAEGLQEGLQQGREKGREEGREKGREEGARGLILRLLKRNLGDLPEGVQAQIQQLSFGQIDALGDVMSGLATIDDLVNWLNTQPNPDKRAKPDVDSPA
jgi:predicted transposase/invertase (TIGR01784 family)